MLEPILDVIGARKLRDLSAADVRQALAAMAAGYSTAAVSMGHLALKRTIRHAEASDLISRNVAALADTPKGSGGVPGAPQQWSAPGMVYTALSSRAAGRPRPRMRAAGRPW